MNLIDGMRMPVCGEEVYHSLKNRVYGTLLRARLSAETVINACEAVEEQITVERHLPLLTALGISKEHGTAQINEAKQMLNRTYLESRISMEFGETGLERKVFRPENYPHPVEQRWYPLGTLFHIAAGNMNGLPAYSVIEGLLTGNINLLKLPNQAGAAPDLSILLLELLIAAEPVLKEYLYVFDCPSTDLVHMKMLADVADGIVVWGGSEAALAVRKLAYTNQKIIEWGHKVSFAYVNPADVSEEELTVLARHICDTNQLLCSSCQGIYLNTEDWELTQRFSGRFLKILDLVSRRIPMEGMDMGIQAQITLNLRVEQLQTSQNQLYQTEFCSVMAERDCSLRGSLMYRNCWVKRLSKERIVNVLKPYRDVVSTVTVLGETVDRSRIYEQLLKTGVVRIADAATMAHSYSGMPRDGDTPLRRYMKCVTIDGIGENEDGEKTFTD